MRTLLLMEHSLKLSLLLLCLSLLAFAQDVSWLVKIDTTTPNGNTISGTGYVVQIGDDLYVKTASHVTLGSENVSINGTNGTKVEIQAGEGVTSNLYDDQLIKINNTNIQPLAIYSPDVKGFVVPQERAREYESIQTRINVGNSDDASYISPEWLERKIGSREKRENFPLNLTTAFSLNNTLNSQSSVDGSTLFAQEQIIPGESGSPLIRENVTNLQKLIPRDLNGNPIDVAFEMGDGFTPMAAVNGEDISERPVPTYSVIDGHAQSYSRALLESRFTATSAISSEMIDALIAKEYGNLDESTWKYQDGVFYREIQTANGKIIEANLNNSAGNGTGGNGGNGTGGNGGNGTGGNGGNGTGGNGGNGTGGNGGKSMAFIRPGSGMIYHDQVVEAFEFNKNGQTLIVYGDWDNLRFLNQESNAGDINPIPAGSAISDLIEAKVKNSNNIFGTESSCSLAIEEKAGVKLFHLKVDGFKAIVFNPAEKDFFPVSTLEHELTGEQYNIDIRGLYSVDLSSVANQMMYAGDNFDEIVTELNYYNSTSHIVLGKEGYNDTSVDCSFSKLSDKFINSDEAQKDDAINVGQDMETTSTAIKN
tara:strand:+ start:248280 stop:250058 length:1779 start_codon:yes stop_codon:yes gene_type:complete